MPLWLKPTYIIGAVLLVLLGVQTWRLSSAHLSLAKAETAQAHLVADIAVQREAGVREGVARQKAAADAVEKKHQDIVIGLEHDNAELKKHYDQTYSMLKDFAAQDRWSCLTQPLPENVLKDFRK